MKALSMPCLVVGSMFSAVGLAGVLSPGPDSYLVDEPERSIIFLLIGILLLIASLFPTSKYRSAVLGIVVAWCAMSAVTLLVPAAFGELPWFIARGGFIWVVAGYFVGREAAR